MKVAVIQLNTNNNKQDNLNKVKSFIKKAALDGADLVSLPEFFNFMGEETPERDFIESIPEGESTEILSNLAKEYGIYIHSGSMRELYTNEKSYNTTLVIDPKGDIIGKYRKIHLFDSEIEGLPVYKESDIIQSGSEPALVDLPIGKAGLSICYDLRFPEMYRNYALKGAKVLFVPSAFTSYTGMLHWEVLLRARAIENQCYVIAGNQFGSHAPGKSRFGNSMIIDPWGTVIARASEGEGMIMAELRAELIEQVRNSIPCLNHRKPELYKEENFKTADLLTSEGKP